MSAIGTAALPLNTWTHLAVTFGGGTLRLYVNGVLVGSQAVSGTLRTSANALTIGGNASLVRVVRGSHRRGADLQPRADAGGDSGRDVADARGRIGDEEAARPSLAGAIQRVAPRPAAPRREAASRTTVRQRLTSWVTPAATPRPRECRRAAQMASGTQIRMKRETERKITAGMIAIPGPAQNAAATA